MTINHEATDLPVCPWCGYADQTYFEYHDGRNYNCGSCGKMFSVVAETSVTFWTEKVEDKKPEKKEGWHPDNFPKVVDYRFILRVKEAIKVNK